MGRRKEPRVEQKLNVRVWGMDANNQPFSQAATTINLSKKGGRISGLRAPLKRGDVVAVQYGKDKARFRIEWIGEPFTSLDGQIGVSCLEGERNIWGSEMPPPAPDYWDENQKADAQRAVYVHARVTEDDRRLHPRYACAGEVQVWPAGADAPVAGRLTDVSEGGCYIQLPDPLEVDAPVLLELRSGQFVVRARGEVRARHPKMGMGIAFCEVEESSREDLIQLICGLATAMMAGHTEPAAEARTQRETLEPGDAAAALELLLDMLEHKRILKPGEFWELFRKARAESNRAK